MDAESISSIRIKIGATEVATEAVEAAKLGTKQRFKIYVIFLACL